MSDFKETMTTMQHILAKLRDVHNSQAALNEKIAAIQIELDALPDEVLDKQLAEAAGHAHDNAQLVKNALDHYEMRMNAFEAENG